MIDIKLPHFQKAYKVSSLLPHFSPFCKRRIQPLEIARLPHLLTTPWLTNFLHPPCNTHPQNLIMLLPPEPRTPNPEPKFHARSFRHPTDRPISLGQLFRRHPAVHRFAGRGRRRLLFHRQPARPDHGPRSASELRQNTLDAATGPVGPGAGPQPGHAVRAVRRARGVPSCAGC